MEPFTSPSVLIFGILHKLLFCPCLQSLQFGYFGVGNSTPNNVAITKMTFKERFVEFCQVSFAEGSFSVFS